MSSWSTGTLPGLRWWNPDNGTFTEQAVFTPPVPGAEPVSFDRGWASIDGRFRGERLHFVNTHLEVAGFAAVQHAQAVELLAGPAFGPGADLVVGDINSAPNGSTLAPCALLTAQFRDAWSVRPGDPRLYLLSGPAPRQSDLAARRTDRRRPEPRGSARRGAGDWRPPDPLHPADHAGVVADLRLR